MRLLAAFLLAVGSLGFAVAASAGYPEDCLAGAQQITLTDGFDQRTYGSGSQCVNAKGWGDDISLGDDADQAFGGTGGDALLGQTGTDELWGQEDGDNLSGGAGSDLIAGQGGNDLLYDGVNPAGNGDTIIGGPGNDRLNHCGGADANGNDDVIDASVETVVTSHSYCDDLT